MSTILPPPSPVISVLSQKGGTGKTTMVRTLADVFRRVGLDVLTVDLDPQGNLSDYFDVDPDAYPTIGEVLSGRSRAADAIHKNTIPANLGLAEAELVLSGKMGRELTLKRAIHESRRQYEMILIDCPPALGLLTVNALVASTHSLVSAEGEYFSLQGVEQVLEVMQLARENLNESLEWLGVVMNIADLRTNHSRDALASLRESFGDRVFQTIIRRSIRYPESAERGESILDYKPELGTDYVALADEIAARLGDAETRERLSALRGELVPAVGGQPGW
jgi:chromosome partitioning protein